MKVTDDHREGALRLLGPASNYALDVPAHQGYLAAVERLDETGAVTYQDEFGDKGTIFGGPQRPVVCISLDDDTENAMHDLTPAQARMRAYELLVLADAAEAAESGAEGGHDA
jgi:hypothetical protein